jgi:hypothetical protein
MGIVNWRQVSQDRDGWRRATRKGGAYPSWIMEQKKKKKKNNNNNNNNQYDSHIH